MQKLLLWRQVLSALCPPGIPRSRSAERERENKMQESEGESELEDTRVRQNKKKRKDDTGDRKCYEERFLFTINHHGHIIAVDN